ncbi:hypothetical protein [Nocardia otitidiscaviarum]|uniref:hypothetical protein n=1 Tax=Nocardia otitidiscaviarum TaxID=1823 RepID=UPI0004A77133|nr:hypothetical protein [Nocardia otitidiscaviarum]
MPEPAKQSVPHLAITARITGPAARYWLLCQHDGDDHCCAEDLIDEGWRPPPRRIETSEQLDTLDFPCVIREIPDDPLEFYPQIWEMAFQVGWCRAGRLFDENDCTPTLPIEVLHEGERA